MALTEKARDFLENHIFNCEYDELTSEVTRDLSVLVPEEPLLLFRGLQLKPSKLVSLEGERGLHLHTDKRVTSWSKNEETAQFFAGSRKLYGTRVAETFGIVISTEFASSSILADLAMLEEEDSELQVDNCEEVLIVPGTYRVETIEEISPFRLDQKQLKKMQEMLRICEGRDTERYYILYSGERGTITIDLETKKLTIQPSFTDTKESRYVTNYKISISDQQLRTYFKPSTKELSTSIMQISHELLFLDSEIGFGFCKEFEGHFEELLKPSA